MCFITHFKNLGGNRFMPREIFETMNNAIILNQQKKCDCKCLDGKHERQHQLLVSPNCLKEQRRVCAHVSGHVNACLCLYFHAYVQFTPEEKKQKTKQNNKTIHT